MARILFIEHDGTRHAVNLPSGISVMDGAKHYDIPGIDGDCGGACACATCHVYVDEPWLGELAPMDELERGMLDFAQDVRPDSRLSCQIRVGDRLDGLVVRIPEHQY